LRGRTITGWRTGTLSCEIWTSGEALWFLNRANDVINTFDKEAHFLLLHRENMFHWSRRDPQDLESKIMVLTRGSIGVNNAEANVTLISCFREITIALGHAGIACHGQANVLLRTLPNGRDSQKGPNNKENLAVHCCLLK
jgi:hypothetical protein